MRMSIGAAPTSNMLLVGCLFLSSWVTNVAGHGYLMEPPSRNWHAHTDGRWYCGGDGSCDSCKDGICPQKESCPMCLNRSGPDAICGVRPAYRTADTHVSS
jgi:hypothetical protein